MRRLCQPFIVEPMNRQSGLTKSATDRKLCGVAGGIANHFRLDPTLVRLGFVLAAFCWGLGIVLYLVACVVMPPTDSPDRTGELDPQPQSAHPVD